MSTARSAGDAGRSRSPLARRFTVRYIIAIAACVAVGLTSIVIVQRNLDRIEAAQEQLQVAAEQPLRVHRILRLGTELTEAGEDPVDVRGLQDASVALQREATALRQGQQQLVGTADEARAELDPRLTELLLGSGQLDARIGSYSATAEVLARFSAPDEGPNRVAPLAELDEAEDRLITDLSSAVEIYSEETSAAIADQRDANLLVVLVGLTLATAVALLLFRPMARKIQRETSQLEAAERAQRENSERQTFRNELSKALSICTEEDEVLATSGRALAASAAESPAELLMISETRDRVSVAVESPSAGRAGCPVDAPGGCAAIRAGHTMVYESSRMLNVCPKLPQHEGGPCSAVCAPLVFDGETIGVLHATGPENQLLGTLTAERLKALAEETGTRLGTLRITKATERLAARDVLTDLDNRRTLLARAAELLEEGRELALAVADLDHFKDLNDTYGHETGDLALQLFADCLRAQLRPEDVIARYGGEEFVVILPDTPIDAAARTIERLQLALAETIRERSSAPFTASWGLTDGHSGPTFQAMLNAADLAMYDAKRGGRNCVVVDDEAIARAAATPAAAPTTPDPGGPDDAAPAPELGAGQDP